MTLGMLRWHGCALQGSKRVPTGLPGWQKLKNNDSTRHPPTPVPAGTLPDSNIRVATGVGGDGYGRLRRRNERPVGGCGCGWKTGGKQNPRFPVIPRNRQHENTDPLNCGLPGTPRHCSSLLTDRICSSSASRRDSIILKRGQSFMRVQERPW